MHTHPAHLLVATLNDRKRRRKGGVNVAVFEEIEIFCSRSAAGDEIGMAGYKVNGAKLFHADSIFSKTTRSTSDFFSRILCANVLSPIVQSRYRILYLHRAHRAAGLPAAQISIICHGGNARRN